MFEKPNFTSLSIFHRESELPACVQIAQKGAKFYRFCEFSKTHVGFTTLCAGNMALSIARNRSLLACELG